MHVDLNYDLVMKRMRTADRIPPRKDEISRMVAFAAFGGGYVELLMMALQRVEDPESTAKTLLSCLYDADVEHGYGDAGLTAGLQRLFADEEAEEPEQPEGPRLRLAE